MSDSRISVREDEEIFRQRRWVVKALYELADNEPIVLYNLGRWSRGVGIS